ncbi:MAG: hypothetical protein H7Y43_10740 [Akkermansiaceae bacterium]|nr:hypothetical protein [Verrucomicrobiales bacterium]
MFATHDSIPKKFIKNWKALFLLTATLAAAGAAGASGNFDRPRGIYALDSALGSTNNGVSMRDANMRTNSFVTGYALRTAWDVLEPAPGQFDFTIIDWNVRKLAARGKKLSYMMLPIDPPWIAQTPGVVTWFDTDPKMNRLRPVPWDEFLLDRLALFIHALAEHEIDGVKFKDHPTLDVLNLGFAGAGLAIRDPSVKLRDMAGYSRAALSNAVMTNLRIGVTNFPGRFVQIEFWPVVDAQNSPTLWEFLRLGILGEFNGETRPRVGFWMENLAASRPAPNTDPVMGRPTTTFGAPLYLSQTNTWVGFQALTSWLQPFNNFNSQVTNATPADGLKYASDTFGCTYFEFYVSDIDRLAWRADFEQWHARLFPPETISATVLNDGVRVEWPSWSGGVYQVESSVDFVAWQTNSLWLLASNSVTAWTEPATQPARYYRLRILP